MMVKSPNKNMVWLTKMLTIYCGVTSDYTQLCDLRLRGFGSRFHQQISRTTYRNVQYHQISPRITKHTAVHTVIAKWYIHISPDITMYHYSNISTYLPKTHTHHYYHILSPSTESTAICQQKYRAWPSHKFWYDVTNASQHSNLRFGFKNLSSTQHDGVNGNFCNVN